MRADRKKSSPKRPCFILQHHLGKFTREQEQHRSSQKSHPVPSLYTVAFSKHQLFKVVNSTAGQASARPMTFLLLHHLWP